ncbi:MAG: TonB family protein [Candidatus Eisenbacteria bacterium]
MSGWLEFASCSASSPVRGAPRGGLAARSSSRTNSLSLLLSGGVHVVAFALVMAAAARSGLEAPREIEIRVWVDPHYTPAPPPPMFTPPSGGRTPDDGRSPVKPTPPGRPVLDQPIDRPTFDPGAEPGVRPDRRAESGEGGARLLPVPPAPATVDPNTPVESYDVPPVPIVAPEPPYDDMPREAEIEGKVVLEALVTWEGYVREVRVREGNPMLAAPAVKTVKTWRFRPARSNGRAVSCWVSIPIVFRLH